MIITSIDPKESYDLVIVGSGFAGITLAKKYEQLAPEKKVLIIESGKQDNTDNIAQDLAKNIATGDLSNKHYKLHNQRVLGGTSTVWGGYCAVLEKRAFMIKSD